MTKTSPKQESITNQATSCSTSTAQKEQEQKTQLKLEKIKHKIAIISGKGGVGKSTVTANLAMAYASEGHKVGILDADLHGPCIPKMLGIERQPLKSGIAGIFPAVGKLGIKVVSMDFFLPSDEAPLIWRGPLKMRAIEQFIGDVAWGELDYLFIDLPPGTGDEPLSIMHFIPDMDGVVIVTMPSELSEAIVKKSVTFAKETGIPVIGIVENLSGYVCPDCGKKVDIFKSGGGKRISDALSVPYLGSIPIDPRVCIDSDSGLPFMAANQSLPVAKAFIEIVAKIKEFLSVNQFLSNQEKKVKP
ncbi:P-loop NTPase [Candidatus Bathyarchaeota archaeon]|nr:P-loop NTPase [Candidatus Bathyarchaeota archaeon]